MVKQNPTCRLCDVFGLFTDRGFKRKLKSPCACDHVHVLSDFVKNKNSLFEILMFALCRAILDNLRKTSNIKPLLQSKY